MYYEDVYFLPPRIGKWMACYRWAHKRKLRVLEKFFNIYLRSYYLCDIPIGTINETTYLNHNGFGIVISPYSQIGQNVNIQHSVTIGIKYGCRKAAKIEDNVVIGAKATIIGPITIGRNSIIGAGSVVVKDVPPYTIVAGNPAKVIKTLQDASI